MRNIKQYIANVNELVSVHQNEELNKAIWEMTMYSPKFPLREQQNQLLSLATTSQISIFDTYFSQQPLNINVYKWGHGKTKIFITHGWGSKGADFNDLITKLLQLDVEIIAFDAPGNGLSEGLFSCLPLYVETIAKIISVHGNPQIMIGHSLGALANLLFLNQNETIKPVLVSIAPFVNLKYYFSSSMNFVNVGDNDKEIWFESFEARFNKNVEQL